MNYFKVLAYHAGEDKTLVFESRGKFEKLWQFSSHILNKGLQVLDVKQMNESVTADDKIIVSKIFNGKGVN